MERVSQFCFGKLDAARRTHRDSQCKMRAGFGFLVTRADSKEQHDCCWVSLLHKGQRGSQAARTGFLSRGRLLQTTSGGCLRSGSSRFSRLRQRSWCGGCDLSRPWSRRTWWWLLVAKFESGRFKRTIGERTSGGLHKIVHGVSTRLDADSQGKHIPGHKNFIAGRSVFHGSLEDAQELVDRYGGTGQWYEKSHVEVVDCEKVIGTYVDQATGERFPTTRGAIHYSVKKDACHIVPARPKEE